MLNSDCASNTCTPDSDGGSNRCHLPLCQDGTLDGDETATDCGGGECPACALGLGCFSDSDCQSAACDGMALVCVTDPCADHRLDGSETDVDCGGLTCARSAVGKQCGATSDCAAGATCSRLTHTCG